MEKFNTFYIHAADYDSENMIVIFHYSFDRSEFFEEKIELSKDFNYRNDINPEIISLLLFHISIAFWISYYKLFPTKDIIIDSWKIDVTQKKYWENFYKTGLWEFFYTNNIDFRDLCNFESSWEDLCQAVPFDLKNRTLLPIWGWKDSIVSAYLLDQEWRDSTPFIFGKTDVIKDNFLKASWERALTIKRYIDPKLFEMNAQWYYNGHVPITGLISFFMTFVCYIYNYKHIVFSNEKSADIGNTQLHGAEINHQYSKSNAFRDDFNSYVEEYISKEIVYSSLLSDMYEIEIAKIFAENCKKYFSVFSSCNKNFSITKKQNLKWCNNCPKCLFVYIILRPFLTHEETTQIFWEELYQRRDLEKLFLEIIWEQWMKPFECVWEVEEAKLWVYLYLKQFMDSEPPYLLNVFSRHVSLDTTHTYFEELGTKYNIDLSLSLS